MKFCWAEVARGRRSGGSPQPPGSILGGILTIKTALFCCFLSFRGRVLFVWLFDCYVVRLSFGLKDCRAARANGAYADSTTKTNDCKQFLKLCFSAGERRGAQNTHGSGKKTHATNFKNLCLLALLVPFFFVPANPTAKRSPKWPPRVPPGG